MRSLNLKRGFFVFLSLLFIGLIFQNCAGSFDLAPMEQALEAPPELPRTSLRSEICPIDEESTTFKGKVIFIVDMSLSNVGGRNPAESCAFSHIPPDWGWSHSLGGGPAYDMNGGRFNALDQLAPLLSDDQTRNLSIMGFHDSAVFGSPFESCDSDMLTRSEAVSSIAGLRAMQTHDTSYRPVCTRSMNSPFKLKGTAYRSAIDCLKEKIEYDLYAGQSTEKSFYSVVFLTDGQPEDASANNFPQMLQNLYNGVQRDILGMKFFPVYYGPQGGEDQTNAVGVLNPMAQVFDPTITTAILTDLSGLRDRLLQDLTATSRVQFNLKNFHAFNLTTLNSKGLLSLDSNMDGMPDGASQASDDGVREIFNKYSANMNDDKDPLPAFIEVLRGTRPEISDYSLDLDLDGISNGIEISEGRDLKSPENDFPTADYYLTQKSISLENSTGCENNATKYLFNISQIATVEGAEGYQDPDPKNEIDFSYSPGENLIMLYFVAEPVNSTDMQRRMYMALVRVRAGQSPMIDVSKQSFKLLGTF